MSGRVSDLSRNGLFMETDQVDRAGTDATLSVALPGMVKPVELPGRVIRVVSGGRGGKGMAIRFRPLGAGVRRTLANYMIERSYQALERG